MAKKRKRIKAAFDEAAQKIAPTEFGSEYITFSFKYFDRHNSKFSITSQNNRYFIKVIERFKSLSTESFRSLKQLTLFNNKSLRFHSIDFSDMRVSEKGFNIPNREELDENAYQFEVSSNSHGRIHGFIIGNTFFVRWFDPEHRLYKRG